MSIRVFIVEDHPVMRGTLVEFLEMSPGMEVSGAAATVGEALEQIPGADPTLVLLDLTLPRDDGFSLLREIRKRWRLPCVVLTGRDEKVSVNRAFGDGARGYVLKGRPWEIAEAIRQVAGGGTYLSESLRGEGNREGEDYEAPESGT